MKIISILGSTGSIGKSTLSVIKLHPEKFKVFALAGFNNVDLLLEQTIKFKPNFIVTKDLKSKRQLMDKLKETKLDTVVLYGNDGYSFIASHEEVTTVVAAITGSAGLISTIDAAKSGKQILLANKESMVMAGDLINEICSANNSTLIPIDSEHNAIFQVFSDNSDTKKIKKVILTASGGPFRDHSLENLKEVTVEEALNHPNWKMGKKISVDSATMMNKGLELIEACWLFSLTPDQIEVVVHPQSIVHSMVEYLDGSILAQLGNPDMRTPIAHALAWPQRISSGVNSLDIISAMRLDFESPNLKKFPCLSLAIKAAKAGGSAPITLNASNEIAVDAFLNKEITFPEIAEIIALTLKKTILTNPDSLEAIQICDKKSREMTLKLIFEYFKR